MEIRNKSATEADLILYGAIGASWFEDSISAKQFSDMMKQIPDTVKKINLRINSPGGDVFDGIAIYNRIKQHPAKVTCYIDGLAGSIASVIALAADEVIMGEGALYFIHLPWTMAMGNRNDLENTVNRLMDVEEQLITIYRAKTKMDRQEIRAMLEKETWLDANQAMDLGFVDSKMSDTQPIAASVIEKASWLNKKPTLKTDKDAAREKVLEAKNKVDGFLKARD